MSGVERTFALPTDLVERLCRALEASDPAPAVRAELSRAGLPDETRETVLEQALLVRERALQRAPRASTGEVQLSLGVLLVLCGALSAEATAP